MNMPQKIDEEDFQLSVEQLDDKYNPEGDGEHPVFTRWDWTQVVAQRSTLSGYWEWVVDQLDKAYFEYLHDTKGERQYAALIAMAPTMLSLLEEVSDARASQSKTFDVDDWYRRAREAIATANCKAMAAVPAI